MEDHGIELTTEELEHLENDLEKNWLIKLKKNKRYGIELTTEELEHLENDLEKNWLIKLKKKKRVGKMSHVL